MLVCRLLLETVTSISGDIGSVQEMARMGGINGQQYKWLFYKLNTYLPTAIPSINDWMNPVLWYCTVTLFKVSFILVLLDNLGKPSIKCIYFGTSLIIVILANKETLPQMV